MTNYEIFWSVYGASALLTFCLMQLLCLHWKAPAKGKAIVLFVSLVPLINTGLLLGAIVMTFFECYDGLD